MALDTLDRLAAKIEIDPTGGCWNWTAATSSQDGRYGYFFHRGKVMPAHRASWELLVGPIPEGLHIDHLCRNTFCVNPDHLEPVTMQENLERGETRVARKFNSHCHRGHEFTPENTRRKANGSRDCRTCSRERDRARYAAGRNA